MECRWCKHLMVEGREWAACKKKGNTPVYLNEIIEGAPRWCPGSTENKKRENELLLKIERIIEQLDATVRDLPVVKEEMYIRVPEAARIFQMSRQRIYRMIKAGKIKAKKYSTRSIRINLDSIKKYINEEGI